MKMKYFILLACLLLTGCATQKHTVARPPAGPSVADIQSLVNAHISAPLIVNLIQNSNTRYSLTADQIIMLKNAGVDDAVLNAMINSATNAPVQTVALDQGPYPYPDWYFAGWPWFGWDWWPYYYGFYYGGFYHGRYYGWYRGGGYRGGYSHGGGGGFHGGGGHGGRGGHGSR